MTNKIKDASADREYFVITPRLVWAKSRSPYDYTLWSVIKDIAGDAGECILSTPQLAKLAMMSAGKVKDCRDYLLKCGLLAGEIRQDPGYPQPVYHLTIPDLWEDNIAFSKKHPKIADRLKYKERSPHERLERSPGERGGTPRERGISPGETKNIHENIQEEDPEKDSAATAAAPPPPTEPDKVPTAQQAMFQAVMDVTLMDPAIKANAARIGRIAGGLVKGEYTPEQVTGLYSAGCLWYQRDWRGQRGDPPTPEQVGQTIKAFISGGEKSKPSRNGKQTVPVQTAVEYEAERLRRIEAAQAAMRGER